MKKLNLPKILSNFIIAFCTSWLATIAIGMGQEALLVAISNALITGLLACGVEIQKEADGKIPAKANNLLVI